MSTPDQPSYTPSEMMIAAAARALGGVRTVFVGVGLPNIACNLARHTVAPQLELDLRGRRVWRAAFAAAALDRRPNAGERGDLGGVDGRSVWAVPARRPGRGGAAGRRAGRSLRQPEHHGDRRLRRAEGAPAGQRRRMRDRDQRAAIAVRSLPAEAARVRRAAGFRDQPRPPGRRRRAPELWACRAMGRSW